MRRGRGEGALGLLAHARKLAWWQRARAQEEAGGGHLGLVRMKVRMRSGHWRGGGGGAGKRRCSCRMRGREGSAGNSHILPVRQSAPAQKGAAGTCGIMSLGICLGGLGGGRHAAK